MQPKHSTYYESLMELATCIDHLGASLKRFLRFSSIFVYVDTNNDDDEIEKTLAILIGLIAGIALIIVFVSFLSKVCEKGNEI